MFSAHTHTHEVKNKGNETALWHSGLQKPQVVVAGNHAALSGVQPGSKSRRAAGADSSPEGWKVSVAPPDTALAAHHGDAMARPRPSRDLDTVDAWPPNVADRTIRIRKPNALAVGPGGSRAWGCLGTPPAACHPCNGHSVSGSRGMTCRDPGRVVRAVLCANAQFTVQPERRPTLQGSKDSSWKGWQGGKTEALDLPDEDAEASRLHRHKQPAIGQQNYPGAGQWLESGWISRNTESHRAVRVKAEEETEATGKVGGDVTVQQAPPFSCHSQG